MSIARNRGKRPLTKIDLDGAVFKMKDDPRYPIGKIHAQFSLRAAAVYQVLKGEWASWGARSTPDEVVPVSEWHTGDKHSGRPDGAVAGSAGTGYRISTNCKNST